MMTRPPSTVEQAAAIRRIVLQSYAYGTLVSLDERAASAPASTSAGSTIGISSTQ